MWIAWNIRDTDLAWPLTIEKKIDIFCQQTLGWQLHVADLIINGGKPLDGDTRIESVPHSGFAVLQICLSYFETIGKYRALGTTNGENFRAGAQEVLPELQHVPDRVRKSLLGALYKGARCGLYHNSRTARGVGLGQPSSGEAVVYDPDAQVLVINPHRLPQVLKCHLEHYRTELLDSNNADARRHFQSQFDNDFGRKQPPLQQHLGL
jgi:hypothetical protein